MTATVEERLGSVERRVSGVENRVSDLEATVEELPEKFAAIVDERNIFYVKSFGRKIVGLLIVVASGAAGAFGKAIIEALF